MLEVKSQTDTVNLGVSELRWQLSNEDLGFCGFLLYKLLSLTEEQACYSYG